MGDGARGRAQSRRGLGWAIAGSASFAIALSVLMILPTSAASSASSLLYGPPYKHASVAIAQGSLVTGCGKFAVQKGPTWNGRTGAFTARALANASGCQSPDVGVSANWSSSVTLSVPITVSNSTSYLVNETFALAMSDSWIVEPYSHCRLDYAAASSECLTSSITDVYESSYLEDVTPGNTSLVATPHFPYFAVNSELVWAWSDLLCSSGHCKPSGGNVSCNYYTCSRGYHRPGFQGSVSLSYTRSDLFKTVALNRSNSYVLVVTLVAATDAQVVLEHAKGKGTPSARAELDMAGPGMGLKLLSIQLT